MQVPAFAQCLQNSRFHYSNPSLNATTTMTSIANFSTPTTTPSGTPAEEPGSNPIDFVIVSLSLSFVVGVWFYSVYQRVKHYRRIERQEVEMRMQRQDWEFYP